MSVSLRRNLRRVLISSALVVGILQLPTTAHAATSNPSLVVSQVGVSSHQLTGKTRQKAVTVYIQRWTGKKWSTVKKTRSRNRAYSVVLSIKVTTKYRARASRRNSPARVAPVLVVAATPAAAAPVPPPPVSPVAAEVSDACGIQTAKPDGTLWSCTFVDNFDGTTLDRTKWTPQTAFATGTAAASACYLDSTNNVSVSGGQLLLTLRKETTPLHCSGEGVTANYSAGMVTSFYKFSQKYGRFEARFKNTASLVPGLHEAFWLWPDVREAGTSVWPKSGEIDITENYSSSPHLAIPFLHYLDNDNGGPVPGVNTAWNCVAERGVFNTYRLDWTATSLKIFVNDTLCLNNTSADPAFAKKYILALTQAMGTTGNELTEQTPVPAQMATDYVKVWQ